MISPIPRQRGVLLILLYVVTTYGNHTVTNQDSKVVVIQALVKWLFITFSSVNTAVVCGRVHFVYVFRRCVNEEPTVLRFVDSAYFVNVFGQFINHQHVRCTRMHSFSAMASAFAFSKMVLSLICSFYLNLKAIKYPVYKISTSFSKQ